MCGLTYSVFIFESSNFFFFFFFFFLWKVNCSELTCFWGFCLFEKHHQYNRLHWNVRFVHFWSTAESRFFEGHLKSFFPFSFFSFSFFPFFSFFFPFFFPFLPFFFPFFFLFFFFFFFPFFFFPFWGCHDLITFLWSNVFTNFKAKFNKFEFSFPSKLVY